MTAEEYVEWVLTSDNPYDHSVNDKEFQAMTLNDQRAVVRTFSGYGLRDMLEQRGRRVSQRSCGQEAT